MLERRGIHVSTYSSAEEFLASDVSEPSCIILNVDLSGMSGLELQAELRRAGWRTQLVFASEISDADTVVRAIRGGAFDFLQKPCVEGRIVESVSQAQLAYEERLDHSRATAAFEKRFGSLTVREKEVLGGVVDGQLNKQIAARLGLSEVTVKIHRANVMRKMQARSLAQLVREASLYNAEGLPVCRSIPSVGRPFGMGKPLVHMPA
jgi:FixJ family two-component response regulator